MAIIPSIKALNTMKNKFILALGIITLILGVLQFVGPYHQSALSTTENDNGFTIEAFQNAKRIIEFEQPKPHVVETISKVYLTSSMNPNDIPKEAQGLNITVIDNVPFYPYWQDNEHRYIFHPMAYGRFLDLIKNNERSVHYLQAAVRTAHTLPNNGLLWYYPNNYRLNRMLGPDLHPSAISQGQILGGITSFDQANETDFFGIARQVFLGLTYDYYHGGVNLNNLALLEIPLFRSAPEIILNGWLHALLYLHIFAEHYQDEEAKELLRSNLVFLAEVLPHFHHNETGLSLYSDLSPYRARISYEAGEVLPLSAFYESRIEQLDNLAFELQVIDHETVSPFDNQIIRKTPTFIDAWLSISALFNTYIVSERGPFSVTMQGGEYSPTRATQGSGGAEIQLQSTPIGNQHVVHITSKREKLFCGYPTNFSKSGENYYHVYHVVALACILASFDVPDGTEAVLLEYMEKWMSVIARNEAPEGHHFSSYELVLKNLIRHGACSLDSDWEMVLTLARKPNK